MFGRITNFFRNLLRSSPATPVREVIHIETKEDLLEYFGQPRELEITDDMIQGIISPVARAGVVRVDDWQFQVHLNQPGVIRLDDGTTIEVPEEYDHDAVRDQYFAELGRREVSDDDIMGWLNGEGQEANPDHLPYNPKSGF